MNQVGAVRRQRASTILCRLKIADAGSRHKMSDPDNLVDVIFYTSMVDGTRQLCRSGDTAVLLLNNSNGIPFALRFPFTDINKAIPLCDVISVKVTAHGRVAVSAVRDAHKVALDTARLLRGGSHNSAPWVGD